jgi:hypothetical protein
MTGPKKMRKQALPAASFRQFNMTFESIGLRGLTGVERMKVVTQLAQLLMLAAGLAEESDDER